MSITDSELLQRYAAGERDFTGIDLSGANLSKADLRDINLNGANLSKVDLSWANLSGANLSRVNASGWGSMNGANLSGANLTKADLLCVEMLGVNLENANTREARLGVIDSAFVHNTIDPDGDIIEGPVTLE